MSATLNTGAASAAPVTDRPTRCACGHEVPLGTSISSLAFFERRGPGTHDDYCKHCHYHEQAHDASLSDDEFREKWGREKPVGLDHDSSWMPPVSRVPGDRCPGFEPMVDGYPTDTYYCGHGGWD